MKQKLIKTLNIITFSLVLITSELASAAASSPAAFQKPHPSLNYVAVVVANTAVSVDTKLDARLHVLLIPFPKYFQNDIFLLRTNNNMF